MVLMCAFVACDNDDDSSDSGKKGSAEMGTISASLNYGFYYIEDGACVLDFSNYNLNNPTSVPSSFDDLMISFKTNVKEGVPTGSFDTFGVSFSRTKMSSNMTNPEITSYWGYCYPGDSTGVKLNISKDGSNYSVKYSGLDLYSGTYVDGYYKTDTIKNTSFSFEGKIELLEDLDDYDDDDE